MHTHTPNLSEGAEHLWRLLAHYGTEMPYTAPGLRAADEWLAETLGVTERTVRRYRAALVAAGILAERLNDLNEVEFRLRRLPAPQSLSATDAAAIARMMQQPEQVSSWLLQWFRWLMEQNGIEGTLIEAYYREQPPRSFLVPPPDGTEPSPTGQPLSQPPVADGTRDKLSHQEEDSIQKYRYPEPIPFTTPSVTITSSLPDNPASHATHDPPAPRHVLRSLVESFGVFPDQAHAIAGRLVQVGYSQAEAKRLLDHLWQETRGQVGLLVYRLTKRPLPPRHLVQSGQWRTPSPRPEREAQTKKLFREMLE